ncbi:MAG TPA: hypothetical protein VHL58_02090 [Thermoanaerobaculia bacterium]|nr:hypothetical protein [Thermoanaerobaculia bacterium]
MQAPIEIDILTVILGGLLLWCPGFLLRLALGFRIMSDPIVRFAFDLSLSLASIPLLMMLTSALGLRWSAGGVRALFALILFLACFLTFRTLRLTRRRPDRVTLGFLAVAALTVASRVEQIWGIAFPPWVDSIHHFEIVRLMIEGGRVPNSMGRFLENVPLGYHTGFHSLVSFLGLLTGRTEPFSLLRIMLVFGQVLSAAVVFPIYAMTCVLARRRLTALLAAAFAGLLSLFPAYFVSWGRYPQMTALLIVPCFGLAFRDHVRSGSRPSAITCIILAAGIVLIDIRTAFFAGTLAIAFLSLTGSDIFRASRRAAFVTLLTGVLLMPALARFLSNEQIRTSISVSHLPEDGVQRSVTPEILWAPRNLLLFSLASAGLAGMLAVHRVSYGFFAVFLGFWIASIVALERRRAKGEGAPRALGSTLLMLGTWCAVAVSLLLAHGTGWSLTRIVSMDSAVSTLYIPACIAASVVVTWLVSSFSEKRRKPLIYGVILACAVGGWWNLRVIVNPSAVLADEADLRTMNWIQKNTLPTARFAIATVPWLGSARRGADGGYWITALTDRSTTLPGILYGWALPADRIRAINSIATEIWDARDSIDLGTTLVKGGCDYIYAGNRLPVAESLKLLNNQSIHLIHRDQNVCVFSLSKGPVWR